MAALLDFIQQVSPTLKGLQTRKMSLKHRPGVRAHRSEALGIAREKNKHVYKCVHVPRFDHQARLVLLNQPRNFSIFCGDGDHRSASGRDTVKLAWDDKALEFRPQRDPVYIRDAK